MLPNFDNLLIVMRFSGEYRAALTDKNRLVVPLRLREEMPIEGQGLDLYLWAQKDHVQIMPASYFIKLESSLNKLTNFNSDVRKFSRNLYSQIVKLTPDSQWRLTLPTQILESLGINSPGKNGKTQLVVLGVGDTMEVWQEDKWNLAKQSLSLDSDAISDRIAYLLMKLK